MKNMQISLRFTVIVLLTAAFFLGCSTDVQENDSHAAARQLISLLKSGSEDQIIKMLTPEMRGPAVGQIQPLQRYAAAMNLDSLRLLDTRKAWSSDFEQASLLFDVPIDTGWVIITVNLLRTKDLYQIRSFNLNTITDEQYHSNDFTLSNKSPLHFLVLLYATIVVLSTIGAIVLCIKSQFKVKWLWILGMILSFPSVTFNWTSGDIGFQPLKFTLLGFSILRYPLIAPWILQTTIPLITIIFLWKWFSSRNAQTNPNSSPCGVGGVAP